MTVQPMQWRNYNDETGVGDPSTPVEASVLNAWSGDMVLVAEATEGFAVSAAASAAAAEAPTDQMMANALAAPDSLSAAAVDVVMAATVADPESAVRATLDGAYRASVDVRMFGAVGDGVADDTAAIQAGIDSAGTFGLATYLPPGRYRLTDTIELRSGTTLRGAGRGSTIIDVTGLGAALGDGKTAITATGALSGATNAISVDVARGAKTCTVASAAGLSVGDTVLLSSDQTFNTTAALKKGEIKTIEAIAGTTVTFADATYDSYSSASAAILTRFESVMRSLTIESLTVEGTNVDNMERGVYIYGADDVTIRDCTFRYCDWNNINLRNVTNFKVTGNTFTSVPWIDNGPNYYGLVVENASAHGVFAHNHGTLCRHLFTTGYTTTTPGVTRFIEVIGNVDTYSQSASYDTHNGCEYVSIIGNTSSYSSANAINVESRQTQVIGNTMVGFATVGLYVRDAAADCTISDNRITTSSAGAIGAWLRRTATSPTRISVIGNTIFAPLTGIRLDDVRVATIGNNIISPVSDHAFLATTCRDLVFTGNHAVSGTTAFRLDDCMRTTLSGNNAGTCSTGVLMLTAGTDTLIVGNHLGQNATPIGATFGTVKIAHNMGVATHDA